MTGEGLEVHLRGASRLLFLCTGNMVRSVFAELYARHRGLPEPLSSAATVYRNGRILPETARALRARGVPDALVAAFRPSHVDDVLPRLGEGAVVLGMTRRHLEALSPWPLIRARAHLLAEVEGRAEDIDDPVLDGADFDLTFDRVARCVDELGRRIAALREG